MDNFQLRRKLIAPLRGELVEPSRFPRMMRLILTVPVGIAAFLAFPVVGRPSDLERNVLRAAEADLESKQRLADDPWTPKDRPGRLIRVVAVCAPVVAAWCWLCETSAGRELLVGELQRSARIAHALGRSSLVFYPGGWAALEVDALALAIVVPSFGLAVGSTELLAGLLVSAWNARKLSVASHRVP